MESFSNYVLNLFYGCLDLSQCSDIILYLGLLLVLCRIASACNAIFQSFSETLCSLMSISKSNLISQLSFERLSKKPRKYQYSGFSFSFPFLWIVSISYKRCFYYSEQSFLSKSLKKTDLKKFPISIMIVIRFGLKCGVKACSYFDTRSVSKISHNQLNFVPQNKSGVKPIFSPTSFLIFFFFHIKALDILIYAHWGRCEDTMKGIPYPQLFFSYKFFPVISF